MTLRMRVSVLSPAFQGRDKAGRTIMPKVTDYVDVHFSAVAGRWNMADLIPPDQLAILARFTNTLPGERVVSNRVHLKRQASPVTVSHRK